MTFNVYLTSQSLLNNDFPLSSIMVEVESCHLVRRIDCQERRDYPWHCNENLLSVKNNHNNITFFDNTPRVTTPWTHANENTSVNNHHHRITFLEKMSRLDKHMPPTKKLLSTNHLKINILDETKRLRRLNGTTFDSRVHVRREVQALRVE